MNNSYASTILKIYNKRFQNNTVGLFYLGLITIIITLMSNYGDKEFIERQEDLRIFGLRIRELRKKSKLTQSELAEKIGLSTNFIGMVERGERNTSVDKIFKLSRAFNLSLAEFFKTL